MLRAAAVIATVVVVVMMEVVVMMMMMMMMMTIKMTMMTMMRTMMMMMLMMMMMMEGMVPVPATGMQPLKKEESWVTSARSVLVLLRRVKQLRGKRRPRDEEHGLRSAFVLACVFVCMIMCVYVCVYARTFPRKCIPPVLHRNGERAPLRIMQVRPRTS